MAKKIKKSASKKPAPRRTPTSRAKKKASPSWLPAICLGLIAALVIGFIKWHKPTPQTSENVAANKSAEHTTLAATTKKSLKPLALATPKKSPSKVLPPVEKIEPTFDFYDVLPEEQLIHNAKNTSSPTKVGNAAAVAAAPATTNASSLGLNHYALQMASFPQYKEADAFKQHLSRLGFIPNIEKTQIQGKTWYRVVLGPYREEKNAKTDSIQLKKLGFNNLLHRQA